MPVIQTHNTEHNLLPRFSPSTQQQLLTLWCWTLHLNSLQHDAENIEPYTNQWPRKCHFCDVRWQPCYIHHIIANLGYRFGWVVSFRLRPLYHLYPLNRKLGGAHSLSGCCLSVTMSDEIRLSFLYTNTKMHLVKCNKTWIIRHN